MNILRENGKEKRVEELEFALAQIKRVLTVPASNRHFMQVAGPARQCLNIIKAVAPKAN